MTEEQDAVIEMIDRGATLDHIEDYIDTLALSGDQASALWLLAWVQATNPAMKRRVVAAAS